MAERASRTESVRYHVLPVPGVEAMTATTPRSFPRHTHDEYGIGLVDAGGHASWSGRGQIEAGPGNFISVNPGEVHDGHAMGGRARSWRILYFEPAAFRSMHGDVADAAEFEFHRPVFGDPRLIPVFETAFAHRDAMASESALLHLIAGLRAHSSLPAPPEVTADVRRARQRLDDDPTAPVTLAELASQCSLSRYQLLRAFTRAFGLPPHAYLLQRRVALARRLLKTGVPPAEVAVAAGFSDQSHLTRCFARQYALTPGRYSRQAR
jgi:AraC-like DNA-binding protein